MFFYEGRTIRGLGLMGWSLMIQLGAVVATGATLGILALLLGPALANPAGFLPSILGVVAAVCGIELGELAAGILFLVGFVDVHGGRHEYGLAHARAVGRATACIVAFVALTLFSTIYSVSMNFFAAPTTGVPTESLLVGNLLLAPLGALVAGLGLCFLVRALVDHTDRGRLWAAAALGVAGAAIGPLLLAFPTALNPRNLSAIVAGMTASAVAGNGMCALSLLLFLLLFRDVRRDLVAGKPAPALPRYVPPFAWAWPTPPTPAAPPGPEPLPQSKE